MSLASIWAALAVRNPTLTYHFAPLIAAVAGPWFTRTSVGHLDPAPALAVVAPGLLLTLVVAAALHATDHLLGPTFWSEDGAIGEAVLFAVAGAAAGLVTLSRPAGSDAAA